MPKTVINVLSDAAVTRLKRDAKKLRTVRGSGVRNTPDHLVIERTNTRRQRHFGPSPEGTLIIQSATKDGANNRWTYSVKFGVMDDSGSWPTYTAVGTAFDAKNLIEINNGSTGTSSGILLGSGGANADLGINVTGISPIPAGTEVRGWRENGVWMFSAYNAPIAECSA